MNKVMKNKKKLIELAKMSKSQKKMLWSSKNVIRNKKQFDEELKNEMSQKLNKKK